jgi:CMP-N-acetylneuraminic acid synthetase
LLLQPTSPLRTAQHIQEAITQWEQHPEKPLVSVCEPSHPPHLIFQSEGGEFWKRLAPLPQTGRRQDNLHKYVQLNGAIYIQSVQRLQAGYALFEENNTNFYHMSYESSIDIDTPLDLMIAQLLLNNSMSAIEK